MISRLPLLFVVSGIAVSLSIATAAGQRSVATPDLPGQLRTIPLELHPSHLPPDRFVRIPDVRTPSLDLDADALDLTPSGPTVIHSAHTGAERLPVSPDLLPGLKPQAAAFTSFESFALGHDPQVAVSPQFLVAAEAHTVKFYDKQSHQLPELNSVPTTVTSYQLFQRFLAFANPDKSPNLDNVNRFAGFPANSPLPCDLTTDSRNLGYNTSCINEVFDLRAAYDARHNRFVFAGIARNQIWVKNGCSGVKGCYSPDDPKAALARRYLMYAMTIDEDPRHGFYTYWFPDGGDWPQIAIAGNYLVMTVNSVRDPSKDPLACIFLADDIANGSSTVKTWMYFASDGLVEGVRPVVIHGLSANPLFLVAPGPQSLKIWAWVPPSQNAGQPPLISASAALQADTGMIRGNPVYQSGKIYLAFGSYAACPADQQTKDKCPSKVRALRIGTAFSAGQLNASTDLDYSFGHQGPGDDPSDVVSYELPSLDVTKNGDAVIAYIREPFQTAKPLYNEVRYSVLYHDESNTRPSVVVHKGEGAASNDPFKASIDLAVQGLDPVDGLTVWVTHAYALSSGGYGMAVGKVSPPVHPTPPPSPAAKCPASHPKNGEPCTSEGKICSYQKVKCPGSSVSIPIMAECHAGHWSIDEPCK